jgi:pimeloyl-ACP methyl ester carboxylesterase
VKTRTTTVEVAPRVRLHVALDGPDDGPPVLVLHGYLDRSDSWDPVAAALADAGFRVVRPDQRGHGRSTKTGDEADYSLAGLRDDAVALADRLSLDTFHLVGHSMGGFLAQLVALAAPDRLRSLVPVSCSPRPDWEHRSEPAVVARARRLVGYRLGPAPLLRVAVPALSLVPATGWSNRRDRRAGLAALVDSAAQVDPAAFVALGEDLANHEDLQSALPRIGAPTTVVVGQRELPRVRRGAELLAADIPGATLTVVANAGHGVPMERPDRFAEILLDHLGGPGGEHQTAT